MVEHKRLLPSVQAAHAVLCGEKTRQSVEELPQKMGKPQKVI